MLDQRSHAISRSFIVEAENGEVGWREVGEGWPTTGRESTGQWYEPYSNNDEWNFHTIEFGNSYTLYNRDGNIDVYESFDYETSPADVEI